MGVCSRCGEGRIIVDPDTSARVCDSCGLVVSDDDYQSVHFTSDGQPLTTLVNSVGDFGYRERRQYHVRTFYSDVSSRLGLSSLRASDALQLASDATDGRVPLVSSVAAAASFLAARQHCIPVPLAEAAAATGEEPRAIGRVASRLSRNLDLPPLPPIDPSLSIARALRSSASFAALDRRKSEEIIGQGRFLIHCAIKWFLSTGRQPLPLVAAVAAFISEVNNLDASIEDIAREIYAGVVTSKARYRELVETLIRAARVLLPWGEDVNAKNLIHHAPLLIRLMEMKSKAKFLPGDANLESLGFDIHEVLDEYSKADDEEDSKYFKVGKRREIGDQLPDMSCGELENLKLSAGSLLQAYKKALERLATAGNLRGLEKDQRKRKRKLDVDSWFDSWKVWGRWNSDKGMTLEQVVDRDVGYDAMPPSFVNGLEGRRIRRAKIEAAKRRIDEIRNPGSHATRRDVEKGKCSSEGLGLGRKRKRKSAGQEAGTGWEDCIIELLLLHQVEEEEIEEGQYKRLLDLHVLSS